MMKLTPTQAATVATMAQDFSEYILARSNADDAMLVYHGARVLARMQLLGMRTTELGRLEFEMGEANKRLSRVA